MSLERAEEMGRLAKEAEMTQRSYLDELLASQETYANLRDAAGQMLAILNDLDLVNGFDSSDPDGLKDGDKLRAASRKLHEAVTASVTRQS